MRYAKIKYNDTINCLNGIAVSLWMQGCHFRCKGCHNPETWDFDGGTEEDITKVSDRIIDAIVKDGIVRNFSILGGEPLHPRNISQTCYIIQKVREIYPDIDIYLWTGYTLEELLNKKRPISCYISIILSNINYLIDGQYIEDKRDLTLKLRGSSNQNIINMKEENINELV